MQRGRPVGLFYRPVVFLYNPSKTFMWRGPVMGAETRAYVKAIYP